MNEKLTKVEFLAELNRLRKTGEWYQFARTVEGKDVAIKGYRAWLQIYRVDGITQDTTMDNSVKQFNAELSAPFNS